MTVTYAGQTWTRNISDWIAKVVRPTFHYQ